MKRKLRGLWRSMSNQPRGGLTIERWRTCGSWSVLWPLISCECLVVGGIVSQVRSRWEGQRPTSYSPLWVFQLLAAKVDDKSQRRKMLSEQRERGEEEKKEEKDRKEGTKKRKTEGGKLLTQLSRGAEAPTLGVDWDLNYRYDVWSHLRCFFFFFFSSTMKLRYG